MSWITRNSVNEDPYIISNYIQNYGKFAEELRLTLLDKYGFTKNFYENNKVAYSSYFYKENVNESQSMSSADLYKLLKIYYGNTFLTLYHPTQESSYGFMILSTAYLSGTVIKSHFTRATKYDTLLGPYETWVYYGAGVGMGSPAGTDITTGNPIISSGENPNSDWGSKVETNHFLFFENIRLTNTGSSTTSFLVYIFDGIRGDSDLKTRANTILSDFYTINKYSLEGTVMVDGADFVPANWVVTTETDVSRPSMYVSNLKSWNYNIKNNLGDNFDDYEKNFEKPYDNDYFTVDILRCRLIGNAPESDLKMYPSVVEHDPYFYYYDPFDNKDNVTLYDRYKYFVDVKNGTIYDFVTGYEYLLYTFSSYIYFVKFFEDEIKDFTLNYATFMLGGNFSSKRREEVAGLVEEIIRSINMIGNEISVDESSLSVRIGSDLDAISKIQEETENDKDYEPAFMQGVAYSMLFGAYGDEETIDDIIIGFVPNDNDIEKLKNYYIVVRYAEFDKNGLKSERLGAFSLKDYEDSLEDGFLFLSIQEIGYLLLDEKENSRNLTGNPVVLNPAKLESQYGAYGTPFSYIVGQIDGRQIQKFERTFKQIEGDETVTLSSYCYGGTNVTRGTALPSQYKEEEVLEFIFCPLNERDRVNLSINTILY